MEIILDDDFEESDVEAAEEKIKEFARLSSINIKSKKQADDEKIWANSRSYNLEFQKQVKAALEKSTNNEESKDPSVFMGKARVKEVIFGRSIRDFLVPISSISEESGNVCFEGEIFGVETKDIHSKKT